MAHAGKKRRRSQITRHMVEGEPAYFVGKRRITAKKEIARINALAIPPAWTDVEISPSASAKILARGLDDAGRRQAIYSPAHTRRQEKKKFARILRFAERLPALRRQVDRDLRRRRLSEEKVVACVIRLMDQQFFRVGNARYARKHKHYGLTTLRRKHVTVGSSRVTFDFIGKSGKRQYREVRDPQIARIVADLEQLPGHELFRFLDDDGELHDVDSRRVNAYIKRHMGEEFSAKDFRTWGGTLLATSALLAADQPDSTDSAALVRDVIGQVADRLGNTPAVTKASYIDPRVFTALEDGTTIPRLRTAMARMRPRTYLTVEEQCVQKVLRKRS